MSKAAKIVVALVTVVIAAGTIALLIDTNKSSAPENSNDQSDSRSTDATITYTDGGFTPSLTTVIAGKSVKIVNQSKNTLNFASAVHPTHNDNSELNLGDIKSGDSTTFTPTQKGAWGFHDHYSANSTGKLVVE